MHLASDYVHSYRSAGGRCARCRVRLYLPEDVLDTLVVIKANKLSTPLVWIEHRSKESTGGGQETFELVVYSSYEVGERAHYLGRREPGLGMLPGRGWIGQV